MYRLRREIEFMDENQAIDIYTSFLKKKRGKNTTPKGIDFVKSYCKIKDKDILKKLEDIHKARLEFLWRRFLNYIIPK